MTINHELEIIFCQSTCPGFLFASTVTEQRALGCDSLSLTAYSCSHWLPGNVVKASLLCSPWLWSSVGQKQGDRRSSECCTALAFFDSLNSCDRLQKRGPLCPPRGHLSCGSLLIDAPECRRPQCPEDSCTEELGMIGTEASALGFFHTYSCGAVQC